MNRFKIKKNNKHEPETPALSLMYHIKIHSIVRRRESNACLRIICISAHHMVGKNIYHIVRYPHVIQLECVIGITRGSLKRGFAIFKCHSTRMSNRNNSRKSQMWIWTSLPYSTQWLVRSCRNALVGLFSCGTKFLPFCARRSSDLFQATVEHLPTILPECESRQLVKIAYGYSGFSYDLCYVAVVS